MDILIQTILGAIFGGIFTMFGGYIQQKQDRKNRDEENKRNFKIKVLIDFYGNKNAIGEDKHDIEPYKVEFSKTLNTIPIAFLDSREVQESYKRFQDAYLINDETQDKNELLYQLVCSMFKDIGLPGPNREIFFTYLSV